MEDFLYFFSFQDASIGFVVLGITLLGIGSAFVGTFSFLDNKALLGDAISHAILPGICLGFMLAGEKNPYFIVGGAIASGGLATYLSSWLKENTKLTEDTIIAVILSVFFGIGIVFLTVIQKSGNPEMAGLNQFIFGNAIGIVERDLWIYGILSLGIISVLIGLFKEFQLLVFNPEFGKAIGLPMLSIRMAFNTLMILAVVIGIQAIGVVLMAALLITPGAAARFWTDRLKTLLILAALFASISGIFGTFVSYTLPQMPTGPWVVVILSLIALLSFLLAPKRGMLSRFYHRKKYIDKTQQDHVLKSIYKAEELGKSGLGLNDLLQIYPHHKKGILKSIKNLEKTGYLFINHNIIKLTKPGKMKAKRIVRLHRLWELYLNEYLNIAPDHVHESAEKLEHLLTPELEALLENRLNFPKLDPHQETIPRDHDDI
ncbi:MAG: metal ABC transporter permease [Algoriphagus sp.]|uniref:metal ABC transporter permease n=1 Tax=Algoriphagus sp. TaxID=1872435 RepID=UPI0017FC3F8B|nr:iron chelate uptake ABC transporter family permease subunit [Algoriphagus sp.]NVJ87606.1 metal ABC transporter permease [Algoriphagus sp.]